MVNVLAVWGKQHKMIFSSEKTKCVMLKGQFHVYRMPRVAMDGQRIAFVSNFKYLGIIFDYKFTYKEHFRVVGGKAIRNFCKLQRVVRRNWGLDFCTLRIVYKGLFEGIVLYGAPVWSHRLRYVI